MLHLSLTKQGFQNQFIVYIYMGHFETNCKIPWFFLVLIFILYLSTCWTGHVFFFFSVTLQPQRPNRLWWTFDFAQFLSSENVWSRLVPLTFHLPPCKAEWVHTDSEWQADHKSESCHDAVRNRMKPRAPVQNQQTRELINTWKTSHKHSNRDQSCLSAGIGVNTRYIYREESTRGTS